MYSLVSEQSPAPFLLQAFYFGGRVAGRVKIGKAKTAILKHAFVLMIAHGLVLFYDYFVALQS